MRFEDLTGRVFDRLTVLEYLGQTRSGSYWLCECSCGNFVKAYGNNLKRPIRQSCGCINKENLVKRSFKHGQSGELLYGMWAGMRARCYTVSNGSYNDYGARGITVCEEWSNYMVFRDWALINGYQQGLTIERKDVDGSYCPENCCWITSKEQQYNKRNTTRVSIFGTNISLLEAVELYGLKELSYGTVKERLRRNWSIEEALFTPKGKRVVE